MRRSVAATCHPVSRLWIIMASAIAALLMVVLFASAALAQSSVRPPDTAVDGAAPGPVDGQVPGDSLGNTSDAEIWRSIKQGVSGTVSIPDQQAAVLVQPAGETWRLIRNGPLYDYLGLSMVGTLIVLALFFAIRGRIRIEHGKAGVTIVRFSVIERAAHWLMAMSFIILAISGLNVSFGRELIMPLIGKEAFGPMSSFLKTTHNYVAFAFMIGLVVTFVMWVIHNLPDRTDFKWVIQGGGILSKKKHPPARKFNAGQKVIFWLVMIGGLSLSISGWALLFPFNYHFFTDTFALFSQVGIDVPAWLGLPDPPYTAIQEQQFNSLWHAIVAIGMVCLIFAHIYIGTIGMEGAFDAMGSGDVDLNWAKEHHSLWVEEKEERGKVPPGTAAAPPQPAE